MIFDTLASMADDANDRIKNFNSTPQQAKDVLVDVDNEGLKTVIDFATKSGNCNIDNETLTVGGRTIVNNKLNELKHVIVGMQQKHPMKIIQDNQNSSSSSSSSPSPYVPSLSCAGGTEPSMVLSVTGASGTINWCGKTWNLPGDSGLSQEVCPSYYQEIRRTTDAPTTSAAGVHWRNSASFNNLLTVKRFFSSRVSFTSHYNMVKARNPFFTDDWKNHVDRRFLFVSTGTFISSYMTFNLGLISTGTGEKATINDYNIPDSYFGSHTVNAVTFTWEKGTNW